MRRLCPGWSGLGPGSQRGPTTPRLGANDHAGAAPQGRSATILRSRSRGRSRSWILSRVEVVNVLCRRRMPDPGKTRKQLLDRDGESLSRTSQVGERRGRKEPAPSTRFEGRHREREACPRSRSRCAGLRGGEVQRTPEPNSNRRAVHSVSLRTGAARLGRLSLNRCKIKL